MIKYLVVVVVLVVVVAVVTVIGRLSILKNERSLCNGIVFPL